MEIQVLTVEKVIIEIKHRNILICIIYIVQVFTNVFESLEYFERDCEIGNLYIEFRSQNVDLVNHTNRIKKVSNS
jgi:hypothetical protein